MDQWVLPAADTRPGRKQEIKNPSQPDQANELVGLAISGGGIRSATFALGACQAMARQGVLERVDYLSTASGGSYLGSGISSLLHHRYLQEVPDSVDGHPMSRKNFPFTFNPEGTEENTRVFKAEQPSVRRLREQSNYLAPRPGIFDTQTWYALVRFTTRAAIKWLVFFLPLFLLGVSLLALLPLTWWDRGYPLDQPWLVWGPVAAASGLLLIFAVTSILFEVPQPSPFKWINRLLVSLLWTVALMLIIVFGVWSVDLAVHEARAWFVGTFGVGAAAFVPFLRWAYSRLGDVTGAGGHQDQSLQSRLSSIGLRLLFGVLGYLLLTAALLVAFNYLDPLLRETTFPLGGLTVPLVWLAAAGSGLWVAVCFLVFRRMGLLNWTSLHSFYRYRLSQAYIQRANGDGSTVSGNAADVPLGTLQAHCRNSGRPAGPYHLIGCSLNIAGSADVSNLGRKSDAFLMSCLYSGSSDTGFVPTAQRYPKLTLGAAMAISGAAFSPNQGSSTSRTLAILMTLFNARLGYWLGNPSFREDSGRRPPIWGGMLYYFLKELFGAASGRDRFVYLTDGGHFDNSGIYELLRRRCRYIIFVDGSGEPAPTNPNFGTLGQLTRLARIDFGVDIRMNLNPLIPSSETGKARSSCAIGLIKYPPVERGPDQTPEQKEQDRRGILVYLKSVITEADDLPDLEFYRRRNSIFPNHSTLDQFFDEAQFEAYRALGYHVGKGAFEGVFQQGDVVVPDDEAFRALANRK